MQKQPYSFNGRTIKIRPIEPDDNAGIAKIIREVLEEHGVNRPGTVYTDPTTDHLFELFESSKSAYYIALDGDEIVGGCGIYPTSGLPEGCAELVKLYVKNTYRGIGLGKALMEISIEFARTYYTSLYLETMPELANAVSLYERLGFKYITGRLGESGHFSCDIWMLKDLDQLDAKNA